MDNPVTDISYLLVAKSDQLNADDLISGPIVVTIVDVTVRSGDQPMTVRISGGHKPWKPCKTTMRVMAHGWGTNPTKYPGRSVELFRDPDAEWGGVAVGGIRISGMSDTNTGKGFTVMLAKTKGGKKTEHKVRLLPSPKPAVTKDPALVAFQKAVKAAVDSGQWTAEQIGALLGCKSADVKPDDREGFITKIAAGPPGSEMSDEEKAAAEAEEMGV